MPLHGCEARVCVEAWSSAQVQSALVALLLCLWGVMWSYGTERAEKHGVIGGGGA